VGSRIGLLMVGHVDPNSVHIAGDYPELFGDLLAGHDLELVRYDLDLGRFPETTNECDGWLCGPSRASAYDDLPWRADAEDLLRRIIAVEAPYVGICFGHQLLAQALGSRVERAADGWQVGAHDYDVVGRGPWMDPAAARITLIASHQDQVVDLPDGATLLASAADGHCPVAGFALGDRAWTLQPHPEFVPPLADHLLAGRVDVIGAERVSSARASLARRLDTALIARWIAHFFAGPTGSSTSGSHP
jgi:GMP synthase-like glutamine amidotransferase